MRRDKRTLNRETRYTRSPPAVSMFESTLRHGNISASNYTLTSSCVAAFSESESSKEAGGRRRDRAGKDRRPEEKGSERHGGTDGAQRGLAGQSHSTGD